jgi:hypothetical protein
MLTSNFNTGTILAWTRPNTNVSWAHVSDNSEVLAATQRVLAYFESNEFTGHLQVQEIDSNIIHYKFYHDQGELIVDFLTEHFGTERETIDSHLFSLGCTMEEQSF